MAVKNRLFSKIRQAFSMANTWLCHVHGKMLYLPILYLPQMASLDVQSDTWFQMVWHLIVDAG